MEYDYDSGARETETLREEEKERKTASRKKRTGGRKKKKKEKNLGSGEEYASRPSERPEYLGWRKTRRVEWFPRDLVGYWVVRYREVLGREDAAFEGGHFLEGNYGPVALRNVGAFVRRQLGGSRERWKEAVEKVLREAPARGIEPTFARFFASPYRGEALASLDKPRGRRGGPPSPREVNDAVGADREYWRREAARESAERRRRRESEAV